MISGLVQYDFAPQQAGQLRLQAGAVVTLLQNPPGEGWWRGRSETGEEGWFPATYVVPQVGGAGVAAPPPPPPQDTGYHQPHAHAHAHHAHTHHTPAPPVVHPPAGRGRGRGRGAPVHAPMKGKVKIPAQRREEFKPNQFRSGVAVTPETIRLYEEVARQVRYETAAKAYIELLKERGYGFVHIFVFAVSFSCRALLF